MLVLGAFGLVVAGLIFVTHSWESLGLAARTLMLLAVSVLIGALGVWVTRRPLRASAEAVWTVFLALLTLDFFAARHEDLLGLRVLDLAAAWLVWGVVALVLAVTIALWARPHVSTVLIAPVLTAALGITGAAVGAGALADDVDFAWRAVIALVVAGVLALATRPAGLAPLTLAARIVVACFFVGAYGVALFEAFAHPDLDDLVAGGHGVPLALIAVSAVVIAAVVPLARIPGVALAVLAAVALVVAPLEASASMDATWTAVAVIAAVLAAGGINGANDWMRGVRAGAVVVGGAVALMHAFVLNEAGDTMVRILNDPWALPWDTRLDAVTVDNHEPWTVPVVLVGLLVVAWAVPRWPEVSDLRPHAALLLAAVGGLGAIEAVVALRLPVWAVAAVLLVLAALALTLLLEGTVTTIGPVALVLVLAAAVLAAASHGVSSVTWLVGAGLVAGLTTVRGIELLRQTYAVAAAVLAVAGVASLVAELDLDASVAALVLLAVGLALVAAGGLLLPQHPLRVPLEVVGAAGVVAGMVVPGSMGELSVRWAVLGAVLVALGLAVASRRWYVWPGAVALLVAYVLLIVDSGFSFVEAYTLPLGAAALAVGLDRTIRKPDVSTWLSLGPGLAVAMLPSVPQALAEPTELRALLLGIGAVVALAVGVRLGWQAPFVAGTTILALLVLFNIGPYANAAPRVALIAAVSAVLLGVGITWEDRVRDGRKIVGYVRSMR
ncbi:hypothetical protein C3E78_07675 [Aeromicrobium chenweiae]|uniref:Uncharacterized protein n=2 Tax=Aeromicrobium chenweiae TaxID=2079793 RepID=A0A2S0WLA9_9ACTN|nr:hypothetical protein C3E78_07675 [Aeromicrobium chenweiae]TGN32936.1 hypothetical protein E4L97_09650 [Aeromicrobium chenweiae]